MAIIRQSRPSDPLLDLSSPDAVVEVSLDDEFPDDGLMFEEGEGGDLVLLDDIEPLPDLTQHDINLAEHLDEPFLTRLGSELVDQVEQDRDDRGPWIDRFLAGMEMLGLAEAGDDDGPFPGASSAILPLMLEALLQHYSRTYPEMLPTEGPVRTRALGDQSEQALDRAGRVEGYLNHEILTEDRSYAAETRRLVMALGMQGMAARKTYRDPILGVTVGTHVAAEDLIVPITAVDLQSAPRYAHRVWRTPNEMRKLQVAGAYRRVDLISPMDTDDEIKQAKREMQDQTATPTAGDLAAPHELYEVYVELEVPGDEDLDVATAEPTGIQRPYIVTVDRASHRVLSIRRNWRADDPRKLARTYITKYEFLPGFGFYSFGLIHLLGGLQEAATGALRTLLDSAALASLQGGFVAKDANIKSETLTIEPGVWQPIESTAEEFSKAFLTPPFREPSPALAQLLGVLTQAGQRLSATTQAMIGDVSSTAAVGTTMAAIEQGSKIVSAVHRGLVASLAEELELRRELAVEFAPPEGYRYGYGQSGIVTRDDLADRAIRVLPVADPNIYSATQRIALAQSTYQLARENPQLIDIKAALRRMLRAINTPDIDELMPDLVARPMDPVTEHQMMLRGQPVRAFAEQDHQAHIAAHIAFAQNPALGANPTVAPIVGPAMQAHLADHLAHMMAVQVRQAGVPVPIIDPTTGQPTQMPGDPMVPPEQIAQAIAQLSPMMGQMQGLPTPPQQAPVDPLADQRARLDLLMQQHQARMQQQMEAHQLRMQQAAEEHMLKMQQRAGEAALSRQDREHRLAADQITREVAAQARMSEAATDQMELATAEAHQQATVQREAIRTALEIAKPQRQRRTRKLDHLKDPEDPNGE